MAPSTPTKVYFIENVETGRIKVGFTTGTVYSRLQSLQTGSDSELRIVAVLIADPDYGTAEWQLHQKLAVHHYRGEWFTREIMPLIRELIREEALRQEQS